MEKQEVREKIIALVKSGDAVINPEDDLRDTLGMDSLDIICLFCECEETFDIALGEEIEDVRTIQDLVNLVFEKTQG